MCSLIAMGWKLMPCQLLLYIEIVIKLQKPNALEASAGSCSFLKACYHIMVLVSTIMSDTSVLKTSSREGLGYSTWKDRLLHQYLGH